MGLAPDCQGQNLLTIHGIIPGWYLPARAPPLWPHVQGMLATECKMSLRGELVGKCKAAFFKVLWGKKKNQCCFGNKLKDLVEGPADWAGKGKSRFCVLSPKNERSLCCSCMIAVASTLAACVCLKTSICCRRLQFESGHLCRKQNYTFPNLQR